MCLEHVNDKFIINQVLALMSHQRGYLKTCFEQKNGHVNFAFPPEDKVRVHRLANGMYTLRLRPSTLQRITTKKPAQIYADPTVSGDHGLTDYEFSSLRVISTANLPPTRWTFDRHCDAFVDSELREKKVDYCWMKKK